MTELNLLTIAGTDPTGAAGITADLGVFRDFEALGFSVITAVVWQNSTGVKGFRPLEPDEVIAQLDAVLEDTTIDGIKIGMVGSPAIAKALAARLKGLDIPIVFDPVMASGTGQPMLTGDADAFLELIDVSSILTPNIPEFRALVGDYGQNSLREFAQNFTKSHDIRMLLKMGHIPGVEDHIQDLWVSPEGVTELAKLPRIPDDVRGTGCAISSALIVGICTGLSEMDSAELARKYVSARLNSRFFPGKGRASLGPV